MRHKIITTYVPIILFIGITGLLYFWRAPSEYLVSLTASSTYVSYLSFVGLLFLATVFAPITVMPVIPMVAPVFGPFITGVLSVAGWSMGAAVAFLIARYVGRPVLARFVSLKDIDDLVLRLPSEARFFTIVMLRMAIPVDLLSYALGFIRTISFWSYLSATIIGVSFFSFAFSYLGDALFNSKWTVLFVLGGVAVAIFILSWYIVLKNVRTDDQVSEVEKK